MNRYRVNVRWKEIHEEIVEVNAYSEEDALNMAYEFVESSLINLMSMELVDSEIKEMEEDYDGPDTREEAEGVR